jgi:GNAT superfamily N-acetyltransferase
MLRPLQALDYVSVKRLFQATFGVSEDKNFVSAWRYRDKDASFGLWDRGALMGAAVVRGTCLEYIFLDPSCRGGGRGTILLKAVLERIPAIHLISVNDPRVIRWYESQGFHSVNQTNHEGLPIYLHHTYNLRSHSTLMEVERREKPVSAK